MAYSISIFLDNLTSDITRKVKANETKAKQKVLEQIVKDTDEFVPYKTGTLAKNVTVSPEKSSITYEEEYASFAFDPIAPSGVPKQYTKDTHPNAQGYPFEAAADQHGMEWARLFREELMNGIES